MALRSTQDFHRDAFMHLLKEGVFEARLLSSGVTHQSENGVLTKNCTTVLPSSDQFLKHGGIKKSEKLNNKVN